MLRESLLVERYEFGARIGQGGMGTVYKGLDRQTGEAVAIKLLKPEAVVTHPDVLERFVREGEALRQLNHPNIVKVLATLQQDDTHYIVMELVNGGSLENFLKSVRQREVLLPIQWILRIALELADALTRAHHLKIIHRDLKPANVLLADDDTPRLTDFGTAYMRGQPRITKTDSVIGTLAYLSPEAFGDEEIDARADIWAFGVLLFEMLTNKRPFDRAHGSQTLMAILTEAPPDLEALRPDCPPALVDLVYRMLEKDRRQRISSVRLIGAELEAIMEGCDSTSAPLPADRKSSAIFTLPTPPSGLLKHNLPAQTTPFVGREDELGQLMHLLTPPSTRLVTILAPGGMGKTRLALELAQCSLEQTELDAAANTLPFAFGVYFVPLAAIHSPDLMVSKIAEAMGFPFSQGSAPKQQLLNFLREKDLLLVLDNIEHLLSGANLIAEILRAAPYVKILATSRERLNLSGETLFILNGMDCPDWKTPADALNYSAVKLFLQSARRARPNFELTANDLSAVARICCAVDGLPLAIVLAAGWIDLLSPHEIADELDKSLDWLDTDLRDVPERHRSLRAVFEYSWNLLTAEERTALAKLSIFHGGFTREAAQTVAGAGLRDLMALVNKSLLRRSPNTGRYDIHELVRHYAEGRLVEMGHCESICVAHADYFAHFLQQRESDLKGKRQTAALDEIEADYANVRAMWHWAMEQRDAATVQRSLDSLNYFCDMRSRFQEGKDLFRLGAEAFAADAAHEQVYGRLRSRQARMILLGYHESPSDLGALLDDSLDIARRCGDLSEQAFCHFLRGMMFTSTNSDDALASFECSLSLYRQLKDKFYWADVLPWIGLCLTYRQKLDEAVACYEESIQLRREIHDKHGLAWSLFNLAGTTYLLGKPTDALRHLQESLAIMREKGDLKGIAMVTAHRGELDFFTGDFASARTSIEDSLARATALHNLYIKSEMLVVYSLLVSILDEDYTQAKQLADKALEDYQQLDMQPEVQLAQAVAAYGLQDYSGAYHELQAVLRAGITTWRIPTLCFSPAVIAQQGDKVRAVELLSMIQHHPQIPEGWRSNWSLLNRLNDKLQSILPPEVYQAAWERGKSLDFDEALTGLLAHGDLHIGR